MTETLRARRLRVIDQLTTIYRSEYRYSDFRDIDFATAPGSVIMRCYHDWKRVRSEPQNPYHAGFLSINWHDKKKENAAAAWACTAEDLDTTLHGE